MVLVNCDIENVALSSLVFHWSFKRLLLHPYVFVWFPLLLTSVFLHDDQVSYKTLFRSFCVGEVCFVPRMSVLERVSWEYEWRQIWTVYHLDGILCRSQVSSFALFCGLTLSFLFMYFVCMYVVICQSKFPLPSLLPVSPPSNSAFSWLTSQWDAHLKMSIGYWNR